MRRWSLTLLLPLLLVAGSAVEPASNSPTSITSPANLRVEGVVENTRVLADTPSICWNLGITDVQQEDWQVEVDETPDFLDTAKYCSGTPSCTVTGTNARSDCCGRYFWSSAPNPDELYVTVNASQSSKGGSSASSCGTMRTFLRTGTASQSADHRPEWMYVRARNKLRGFWGPWAYTRFKMDLYPLWPTDVVATALGTSTGPDYVVDYPPAAASPSVRYVATTGVDAGTCTSQGSPCLTIAYAWKKAIPGDDVELAAGTWNETVQVSVANGFSSGNASNPITVRPANGAAVNWNAAASQRFALSLLGTSSNPMRDVIVKGINFGGATLTAAGGLPAAAVEVNGAENVVLDTLTLASNVPTGNVGVKGIYVWGNTHDLTVKNCTFNRQVFDQIEVVQSTRGVELYDNDFSNCYPTGHCLQWHGGAHELVARGNKTHDSTSSGDGLWFLYLQAEGSFLAENEWWNVAGTQPAIYFQRSGMTRLWNNSFFNVTASALGVVFVGEWGPFLDVRGNIFSGSTGYAIRLGGHFLGASTRGDVLDYNLFYQNAAGPYLPSNLPRPGALNCTATDCFDHDPVGNLYGVDPLFTNPGAGDLTLQSGSPARDAGDPTLPVPVGGGSRVDIGRREFGATWPYDYQSRFTIQDVDSTPQVSWTFVDPDNFLVALGLMPGPADFQSKYQLQLDAKTTFDSVGGHRPSWDSGEVTSTSTSWTVPKSRPLSSNASYYVRVRTWDQYASFYHGPWSDPRIRLTVPAGSNPGGNGPGKQYVNP